MLAVPKQVRQLLSQGLHDPSSPLAMLEGQTQAPDVTPVGKAAGATQAVQAFGPLPLHEEQEEWQARQLFAGP